MGLFGINGKKKLTIEIDKKVYDIFMDKIKQSNLDEFIEELIRNYITGSTAVSIPSPISSLMGRTHYDNEEDIEFIAYCFSNYEHTSLYPTLNQGAAFAKAAKILDVNVNTLKNKRDAFDGNYKNIPFNQPEERRAIGRRLGWSAPLNDLQQKIKDKYDLVAKRYVIEKALQILNKQTSLDNSFSNADETIDTKNKLDALILKWLRKKTAPYNVLKSYFITAQKYGENEVTQERMQRYAFNELHENNFQPNFSQMKNGGNSISAYRIFDLKYHPSWGNKVILTDEAKNILDKYEQEFLQ